MNFYLDFEATQFTEEIISIGCVAENGDEFSTLVKPTDLKKVTNFITNLTGITRDMLINADSADVSFLALREFIRNKSKGEETFFFVYGNADSVFIEKTVAHMIDPEAKKFAYKLGASLIDFTTITNRFFRTGSISLKNAVAYFRQEEVKQNHHAVDDAELLRELVYMVNHCEMPESPIQTGQSSRQEKMKLTHSQLKGLPAAKLTIPAGYTDWISVPKCWYPSGTVLRCCKDGKVERPYTNITSACSYVKSKEPTKPIKVIEEAILDAAKNQTNYHKKKWIIVE